MNWLRSLLVRWLDLDIATEIYCPCDECKAWRARRTPHQAGTAVMFTVNGARPQSPGLAASNRALRLDN